ncbi:MAG TPA: YIP1 family protein [Anaerolineales bacterium]|nr:YIP1 family protein [Anaerolineales bacterium]
MSAGSNGVEEWFSTWMIAVTKPNEQTFATLAKHPDAKSNTLAFTWVFLAGTISALISGVFQSILQLAGFASQTPGLSDLFGGDAQRGIAFTFGVALCSSPIVGALGVVFFAMGVGIVQWVARLFKGTGTYSQLAYTMAAVSVPFTLVSSILTPFSGIPVVGICTGLISTLLGIYALVLELMAVKGVNKFGWGQAAGSIFLPGLALVCCVIVVIAGMSALGVAIGGTFDSINQNLTP